MLERQGAVFLGHDSQRKAGSRSPRLAHYALALLTLSTIYLYSSSHSTSSGYPPSRSSAWSTPSPSSGSTGRVHSFAGPERAAFELALADALANQTSRPIPSHSQSLARQTELCPSSHAQSDQKQLADFGPWWSEVGEPELASGRDRLARAVGDAFGLGRALEGGSEVNAGDWESKFGDGRRGIVYSQ